MRRGLSQGGRWLFKKGVREGKTLAEGPPLRVQALRSSIAPTPGLPPSPSCCSLTSDVSKIPNGPVGLQARPPPNRKSKGLGHGNSDLSHTPPPKARGPGRGSRRPVDTVHPSPPPPAPQACISQDSKTPPRPRRLTRQSPGKLPKEG